MAASGPAPCPWPFRPAHRPTRRPSCVVPFVPRAGWGGTHPPRGAPGRGEGSRARDGRVPPPGVQVGLTGEWRGAPTRGADAPIERLSPTRRLAVKWNGPLSTRSGIASDGMHGLTVCKRWRPGANPPPRASRTQRDGDLGLRPPLFPPDSGQGPTPEVSSSCSTRLDHRAPAGLVCAGRGTRGGIRGPRVRCATGEPRVRRAGPVACRAHQVSLASPRRGSAG